MPEYIREDGSFTDDFRTALPELLGGDYFNDKEKQQPTKELDNVKDLSTLLRKTVNASRKISAHGEAIKKATEGMVKIPGEGATPEEIAAYRKAHGVPETPDGYALTIPENDKEGFEAIAKEVKAAAHETGIAPSKLASVWDKVVPAIVAQAEIPVKKDMELLAADIQALKDAKKEKYDAFIADTNKVAAHFDVKGESGAQDNPIGSNFMKLMDTMGIKDTPVVREFLGAIAPLVLEKGSHLGGPAGAPKEDGGFTYQYDANGKPI